MAWTDPRTWAAGELVTAALLNIHLKDNLVALKSPPKKFKAVASTSVHMVNSGTFVSIYPNNNPPVDFLVQTKGGDVFAWFTGRIAYEGNGDTDYMAFKWFADGVDNPLQEQYYHYADTFHVVTLVRFFSGLTAGSHYFDLRWRRVAGTGMMKRAEYFMSFVEMT